MHLADRLAALTSHEDCSTLPVLSAQDRPLVAAARADMDQYLVPADKDTLNAIISELDVLPRKRESDDEAEFKLNIYLKALADLPGWAVRRAVNDIIREENWFPVPAQIRKAADGHLKKARWRRHCLEQWLRAQAPALPEKYVTAEEADAILREFGLKRDPVAMANNAERTSEAA